MYYLLNKKRSTQRGLYMKRTNKNKFLIFNMRILFLDLIQ